MNKEAGIPFLNRIGDFGLFGDEDFITFKQLFQRYFWKYWKHYAGMGVLIAVSSGATAMSAWLVRDVVKEVFIQKNSGYLVPLVAFVVAIFLTKGFSTYAQSQIGARIANDIVADVQRRLFSHFLKQRLGFFETYSSDDLIMRITQGANSFSSILNRVVVNGVRDAATVIALLAVMIAQDAALTAICFLAVPAIFYAINKLLSRIKQLMQQEMRTFVDLNRYVREIVQGTQVIKSYNVEPLIQKQADEAIENIRTISNRVSALNNAPIPAFSSLLSPRCSWRKIRPAG